jgi:glycosyltransferase involved in cell wall biosynthesis
VKVNDNDVVREAKNRTRVLLVSPLPPPAGGIATWTKILLEEVSIYPEVLVQHLEVTPRWKRRLSQSQMSRVVYGTIRAFLDILRIAVAMIVFRPHVLHLTSSAEYALVKDVIVLFFARLLGVSGLIHYRTSKIAEYQLDGGWKLQAALIAMRLANIVMVLEEKTYVFLERTLPKEKLKRIPNMIDLQEIDDLIAQRKSEKIKLPNNNIVRLVFVGRAYLQKGVVELVTACSQIEGVVLDVVGEINYEFGVEIKNIAKKRDDGNWLVIHGQLNNREAWRQIQNADIFLLPSYHEAFPNALLEAMALGKPAVVSKVGAMPEMINDFGDGPCGVCVEPKNAESLRMGLMALLENPSNWSVLGGNGRRRVEALYSTSSVMRKLVSLWQDIGRVACASRNPRPNGFGRFLPKV